MVSQKNREDDASGKRKDRVRTEERPADPAAKSTPDAGRSTAQVIGRQPSFKVNPQPARPQSVPSIRREPSFRVRPQSPVGAQSAPSEARPREEEPHQQIPDPPAPPHRNQDARYSDTLQRISDESAFRWRFLNEAEKHRQAELAERERQEALHVEEKRRQAQREESRRRALRELEKTPYREIPREEKARQQALVSFRAVALREKAQQNGLLQRVAPDEVLSENASRWRALKDEQARQESLRAEATRLEALRAQLCRREEEFQEALCAEQTRRQAMRERTREDALRDLEETPCREGYREAKVQQRALGMLQETLRIEAVRHNRAHEVHPRYEDQSEEQVDEFLIEQQLEEELDDAAEAPTPQSPTSFLPPISADHSPPPPTALALVLHSSSSAERLPFSGSGSFPEPSPSQVDGPSVCSPKSRLPAPLPSSSTFRRTSPTELASFPPLLGPAPSHSSACPEPISRALPPPESQAESAAPIPLPSPRSSPTPSSPELASLLPSYDAFEPDIFPPTTQQSTCRSRRSSPSPKPPQYRVPSPTFDHPTSPPAVKADPSAQFMSLLLRQGEQMASLMQQLVASNQELRTTLTQQFSELSGRLDALGTSHTNSAPCTDQGQHRHEDEDGDHNGESKTDDMEREGTRDESGAEAAADADDELGQDELTTRARRRKGKGKVKKTSLLNDPQLKDGVVALQACVRKHLFTLCNVETVEELIEKNPPITDEEMDSFLEGDDDMLTCSIQSFRIDFERPWKDNEFNRLAKSIFVRSLIQMYKSGTYPDLTIPEELLTEKVVGKALDGHMEYRRKCYRQHFKALSKTDLDKIKKRKAMNSRRATLRDNRIFVILEFGLNEHRRLFSLLRPIHMSGDETDGPEKTHPPTFRIVEARWQSLALKLFFRRLDALYRECWAKPVGERATCGNPPRIRVERKDARVEDSIAPIGLWRNCYDEEWLRSLRPHVRASLNVIQDDYKFTLPAPKPSPGRQ